jgi:hypothetical protein
MYFLASVIVLAAVIVAFLAATRLFRSPSKPKWLDNESVVMAVCVAFTGAFAASMGAVLATSLSLPLGLWGDVVVSLVSIVAIILLARVVFHMVWGHGVVAAD